MNFQKTLLAAALAIASIGAQAATESVLKADVVKYTNAEGTAELYQIKELVGTSTGVVQVGWYEKTTDGKLVAYTKDTSGFTTLISAGQVQVNETPSSTVVNPGAEAGPKFTDNTEQNDYWSFTNSSNSTTTVTEGSFTLEGQLVNTTLHGNDGVAPEDILGYTGVTLSGSIKTTSSLVKKDIQIGNLTEVATGSNTGGLSDYDFKLTQNNAQGTLATIKATAEGNTSVAAVIGNGLAVLDVTSGALVDLEKGQVISTRTEGSLNKQPATELTAYNDAKDARVVEFGGKYYEVKGTDLVAYEGATSDKSLTKVGKGTADQITGGLNVTSTNTGLVSNQNVHYGESVTKQVNAGQLTISSTNPEVANSTSGNQFAITSDAPTTTSSKDVKTGIIATDKDGNKTYGLQATNVVDNKVTAQTTLTAEGITPLVISNSLVKMVKRLQ